VNHFTSSGFWRRYEALPKEVRDLADKQYALLKMNPSHPSLRFKKLAGIGQLASAWTFERSQ